MEIGLVVGRILRRLILGLGVVVATAGPSFAQPVSREELGHLLAGVLGSPEDAIEEILDADLGFAPDSAALLVRFAGNIYSNPDFQGYLLARLEEVDRALVLRQLEDFAASARSDAYRLGTLRLPPSGLDAFMQHIRDILVWLSATNPALCAALARDPASVLDTTDVELHYFAEINPGELRRSLRYQTAAIVAEASDAPPFHAFSRSELAAGRAALTEVMDEAATLPPPGAACTIVSICIPPPTEDEASCSRALIRFEAYEALPEPQRAWAIAAFIVDL